MKNSEIHNDLSENDMRDFLTKSLANNHLERINMGRDEKYHFLYKMTDNPILGLDQVIANREKDLERYTIEIASYKADRAIYEVMQMKGWTEHDVSDHVVKDFDDWYLSFIGTEEEYGNILLELEQ